MKTLVIVSGYFNPLHKGHVEYLYRSKELGDSLLVIVNNDVQRALKGSKPFMSESERRTIIQALKPVDYSVICIDQSRSVSETVQQVYTDFKDRYDRFIFANGGDQTEQTIPETEVCNKLGIEMVFGLGDKIQSSSWLLK